ncbi:FtsB family cell division protein [Nesterenkonia natronophila]|uniref:Septum formation initiator family protein n=1 Tax=Nesterenkonia natronophila TaxID=2174932 RepID=A0A3A4F1V4_9MICC|nr:septum formation initiator family protein [Nesterenkonia natronophila]RJN32033.1 septum formation initiator family protein [Nesterenkonia natronophila]
MPRHARSSDAAAPAPETSASGSKHRAQTRAERARARRLQEREQVSGEIRTPDEITARRARQADRPRQHTQRPSTRTPVSARTLVPERTFSGRMIVLTIVTLVVISFLVPTVRTYMQQRAELNELAAEITEEQQRQEELYSELARWDDPQFVQRQARERINLMVPGERRYHVIGDLDTVDIHTDSAEDATEDVNWADDLWESVIESAEQ